MTKPEQKSSLQSFSLLNELLQFAPTDPREIELKNRVAKVGLGDGLIFDVAEFSPEIKTAIKLRMADAWADISVILQKINAGELTPGECYGTRQYLENNFLYRASCIVLGGNAQPKEEVIYPIIALDEHGKPLNGSNAYTITFVGDQHPPTEAFFGQ